MILTLSRIVLVLGHESNAFEFEEGQGTRSLWPSGEFFSRPAQVFHPGGHFLIMHIILNSAAINNHANNNCDG